MNALRRIPPLVLLLAAAATVQVRYLTTAVLPAQDVVDVVSVAQRIDRDGLATTIRRDAAPAWFAACVAATHRTLEWIGALAPDDWATAAQIAAALPLVLLVVPAYLTARRLGGPAAATIAGLFVVFLPATARLGADGLGDSWHLLLAAWAILALTYAAERSAEFESAAPRIRSWRRRLPLVPPMPPAHYETWLLWWLAGTGFGAALLVRPEAAVAPIGIGLVFAADRLRGFLRAAKSWTRGGGERGLLRTSHFLSFASGTMVCLVPYALAGITSPADYYERLRGGAAPSEEQPFNDRARNEIAAAEPKLVDAAGEPLVFGHKDRSFSTRVRGPAAVAAEFATEFLQATAYVLPLLAAAGYRARRRTAKHPADRYRWAILAVFVVGLFVFTWKNGYLSSRHFGLAVVGLLPEAALGLIVLGGAWAGRRGEAAAAVSAPARRDDCSRRAKIATAGLAVTFVAVCLAATLRPVHRSQMAHRRAAEWLRSGDAEPGAVLDQQGWTALYTGRKTYRFDAAERALADPRLAYVVVERRDWEADSPRGRSLRAVLGGPDGAVAVFAADRGRRERDVLIFPNPSIDVAQGGRRNAR